MTPQLQQAIKLLQLNNLELTELVNKELEENPFLENESNEEQVEKIDDETNDLSESFESGESIKDEPKNEDYDNRWDTDLSFQSYSKSNDKDSIEPKYGLKIESVESRQKFISKPIQATKKTVEKPIDAKPIDVVKDEANENFNVQKVVSSPSSKIGDDFDVGW